MSEVLIQAIFGWPAILTCILLSVAGIWLRMSGLLIASGILCLPFTYYLMGSHFPLAFLLPVCQFGAAYAIKRQSTLIALGLIAPLVIISVLLAYTVLTQ